MFMNKDGFGKCCRNILDVCEHGQSGYCSAGFKCRVGHTCMFINKDGVGRCCRDTKAGLDSDNVRANQPSKTVEPLINDQAAAHTGDLDDIVKNRIAIEQVDVPGKSQNDGIGFDNVVGNQPPTTVVPLINNHGAPIIGDLEDFVNRRIDIEQVDARENVPSADLDSDNEDAYQPPNTVVPLINDQGAPIIGYLADVEKKRLDIEQVDARENVESGGDEGNSYLETVPNTTPEANPDFDLDAFMKGQLNMKQETDVDNVPSGEEEEDLPEDPEKKKNDYDDQIEEEDDGWGCRVGDSLMKKHRSLIECKKDADCPKVTHPGVAYCHYNVCCQRTRP
ncbi:uncharacterized protein LOC127843159 [Dreissena polymorpha]|uniref:uncharacterized protein LOC127843159 n=1 Tax=Dreissena polymorpha TaxID=45954 RepID=UPI002264EF8C|nr:uncharacterized protein LOC127843159 [Dreissena polymorpha]